ncbi:MAG: nucleotide exchange factor GrpE, partial [Myxococcales bacterium]|nr:nucleotide exchange factor GrpE [Myxococcales bacterium]
IGAREEGRTVSAENEGKLEAELTELRAAHEALQDQYVRLQADYDNHRKRVMKERQDAHNYGHENIVKDLLGTVDNLERAIEHARSSAGGDFEAMLQGVELVQRELIQALDRHGVSVIEAAGEAFDPAVHEAMAQQEDDSVPQNTVVQVFAKGYQLRDRLLRPAKVIVSKKSETALAEGASAAKLQVDDIATVPDEDPEESVGADEDPGE